MTEILDPRATIDCISCGHSWGEHFRCRSIDGFVRIYCVCGCVGLEVTG